MDKGPFHLVLVALNNVSSFKYLVRLILLLFRVALSNFCARGSLGCVIYEVVLGLLCCAKGPFVGVYWILSMFPIDFARVKFLSIVSFSVPNCHDSSVKIADEEWIYPFLLLFRVNQNVVSEIVCAIRGWSDVPV